MANLDNAIIMIIFMEDDIWNSIMAYRINLNGLDDFNTNGLKNFDGPALLPR